MKIGNKQTNKQETPTEQQGVTIAGRFIPYTWLIGFGGALIMIVLFVSVRFWTGDDESVNDDVATESELDVDETDNDPLIEEENTNDSDRMWDEYLDEQEPEQEPETDTSDDDEPSEGESADDTPDEPEDVATSNVSNEEIEEVIRQFLINYKIRQPGYTAEEHFNDIYPYVTEELANELVPNRGAEDAAPSIDVTHELVDMKIDKREGVDNEYAVTLVYTSEAMNEIIQYTDVYSIRTNGERVTAADIRSSTWD